MGRDALAQARETLVRRSFDRDTLAIANRFLPDAEGHTKAALQVAILDLAARHVAAAAIDAALEGGEVPKDGDSHRTVFAWAWTLFGNGSIWLRALTWTKDDPFAVEVANPNFKSVAVPLYTDEELSAALPSALDLPSPPTGA